MNIKGCIEKIIEVLAFKRRQRQFCKFIEAVDNGDFIKVKKMLQHNPKLVSVQCVAPKGFASVPSWLKMANPLAIALVPTLTAPSCDHIKIVEILIQNGADPLSTNDNFRLNSVLEVFLVHALNNARFDDPHSVERMMCNQVFLKVEQEHVLENFLQDISAWRRFQKDNPQLSDEIIQEVYAVKAKNIKKNIERQLDTRVPQASSHRKM